MKRWFLRIRISHFLRFAMSLAKLMIAVSLPLARVILQGCGGEEEEATTLAQNATTNIVTNCDGCSAGQCGTRFGTAAITNTADTGAVRTALLLQKSCLTRARRACVPFMLSGSGKWVATFHHAR